MSSCCRNAALSDLLRYGGDLSGIDSALLGSSEDVSLLRVPWSFLGLEEADSSSENDMKKVVEASMQPGTGKTREVATALAEKSVELARKAHIRAQSFYDSKRKLQGLIPHIKRLQTRGDAFSIGQAAVLAKSAIQHAKVAKVAEAAARNAAAQAVLAQEIAATVVAGQPAATATLAKIYKQLGSSTERLKDIRRQQIAKSEASGSSDEINILRVKQADLERRLREGEHVAVELAEVKSRIRILRSFTPEAKSSSDLGAYEALFDLAANRFFSKVKTGLKQKTQEAAKRLEKLSPEQRKKLEQRVTERRQAIQEAKRSVIVHSINDYWKLWGGEHNAPCKNFGAKLDKSVSHNWCVNVTQPRNRKYCYKFIGCCNDEPFPISTMKKSWGEAASPEMKAECAYLYAKSFIELVPELPNRGEWEPQLVEAIKAVGKTQGAILVAAPYFGAAKNSYAKSKRPKGVLKVINDVGGAITDVVGDIGSTLERLAKGDIIGLVEDGINTVAKIAGSIFVGLPCKLIGSAVGQAATQVAGAAAGGAFGGPAGGAAGAVAANRIQDLSKSVCGGLKELGLTEGKLRLSKFDDAVKTTASGIARSVTDPKNLLRDAKSAGTALLGGGGAGDALSKIGGAEIAKLGIDPSIAADFTGRALRAAGGEDVARFVNLATGNPQDILKEGQRLAQKTGERYLRKEGKKLVEKTLGKDAARFTDAALKAAVKGELPKVPTDKQLVSFVKKQMPKTLPKEVRRVQGKVALAKSKAKKLNPFA
jgi:hypothetical protein